MNATERTSAHLDDDRLLDLVHGLSSEEDTRTWLDHLRACATCEERFRAMDGDREYQRSKIAACHASSAPTPARSRAWLLVAASVATIAIAVAVVTRVAPERSAATAHWIPVDEETLRFRSDDADGGPTHDAWYAALDAYERRDVELARVRLEEATAPAGYEDVRAIYLADVWVRIGRSAESLALLDDLDLPTLPPPWRERALRIVRRAEKAGGRDPDSR